MSNKRFGARLGKGSSLLLSAWMLTTPMPAQAALISFDFDTMAYRSSSTPGPNWAVQTYLNDIWSGLGLTGSVTVTGAGELSNNQYTGDGHVVGPAVCTQYYSSGTCKKWSVTALTLGNTDGGVNGSATLESPAPTPTNPDNYIVNYNADKIVITFPTPIYSASFDFEIFPDGTCPTLTSCGTNQANLPDFKFVADSVQQFLQLGVLPGSPGTFAHSPDSGGVNNEKAPQWLGVSGVQSFGTTGVTTLEFVDWPRRIGIDNLVVDTGCAPNCRTTLLQVPEPPTLPIVALALVLLAMAGRHARRGLRTRRTA